MVFPIGICRVLQIYYYYFFYQFFGFSFQKFLQLFLKGHGDGDFDGGSYAGSTLTDYTTSSRNVDDTYRGEVGG